MEQLKYNFPTIFLENYKKAVKKLNECAFPSNPKLIICGSDQSPMSHLNFYS